MQPGTGRAKKRPLILAQNDPKKSGNFSTTRGRTYHHGSTLNLYKISRKSSLRKSSFENYRSKIEDLLGARDPSLSETIAASGGLGKVTDPVPRSSSCRFTRSMSTTSFFDS
jgi:hypothetical protein